MPITASFSLARVTVETHGIQKRCEVSALRRGHVEFQGLHGTDRCRSREGYIRNSGRLGYLAVKVHQGAMPVTCNEMRVCPPELVIEDFQRRGGRHSLLPRPPPPIAGDPGLPRRACFGNAATDREKIHIDRRRVGKLKKEDPVSGNAADAVRGQYRGPWCGSCRGSTRHSRDRRVSRSPTHHGGH